MAKMEFNENLYIDKNEELRKQEIAKFERTIKQSLLPAIIVAITIAIYLNTIPQEITSEMIIPINISGKIETNSEYPGIGSYKSENEHILKINPSYSLSQFESNGIDRIFATGGYDEKKDVLWLLIRGINYTNLPNVTDYYTEFEKPYVENDYIYATKEVKTEMRNTMSGQNYPIFHETIYYLPNFGPERYQLHSLFKNRQDISEHREIVIRHTRIKYAATYAALIAFGGIITFVFANIVLMSKKEKKNK